MPKSARRRRQQGKELRQLRLHRVGQGADEVVGTSQERLEAGLLRRSVGGQGARQNGLRPHGS